MSCNVRLCPVLDLTKKVMDGEKYSLSIFLSRCFFEGYFAHKEIGLLWAKYLSGGSRSPLILTVRPFEQTLQSINEETDVTVTL